MKILALDLSSPSGSIALMEDGVIAGEYSSPAAVVHSTWLPGAVRDFLEPLGRSLNDIDIFATTVGPGSFTGTRVAISTVKGLAWGLGRRVYGASTLKAIAHNVPVAVGVNGAVCAVLDARKGEVYAALYRRAPGGGLETLMEECVLTPAALVGELGLLKAAPVVFTGDGVKVCTVEALLAVEQATTAPEALWTVKASVVARMAHDYIEGAVAPEFLSPVYLRKPGAVFKKPGKAK